MKNLGSVAIISLLALVGCENTSRLDKSTSAVPKNKAAEAAAPSAGPLKVDHSGTLEERVARLEENFSKYGEALDFLQKVYGQQKAQQAAAERDEPAPDAVFAIETASSVKAGLIEGPAQAPVTIVEAWDFA
jgi:hypothetical protein